MPVIILTKITNDQKIKGSKKVLANIRRRALKDTAKHWHEKIFPRHFDSGNNTAYQLRPRSEFYRKVIKRFKGVGTGRFYDLVLSGRSSRAMRRLAMIRGTSSYAQVTMPAPPYFTNPTGPNQPDKAAEVIRFSNRDRTDLQQFFRDRTALLAKEFE